MSADSPASAGVLYIVATPIGNLEDVTARALRVLREADLIAAEDTRVTRKLLAHFDIHTPLTSYHAHSGESRESALIARLVGGAAIALVSDAGTPAVSDPGAELVAQAIAAGIRVEPIPGPSALLAALVASGLPTTRFVFEGFLPRTRTDRAERIAEIARETQTIVLYEAPPRLVDTLKELQKALGSERQGAVGREITKKFEEFQRGTLSEITAHYTATPPRGECVIVIEGGIDVASVAPPPDVESLLRDALASGISPRDAARQIATATSKPRNEIYALAIRLSSES